MRIFEKVMQERHPISDSVTLTPRDAFAAIVVGVCMANSKLLRKLAIRHAHANIPRDMTRGQFEDFGAMCLECLGGH